MVFAHMLGAGSEMQQGLGLGGPGDRAGQQQFPQHFGAGRTAGFACLAHGHAEATQRRHQQARLGGFAGTLAAFEGDEAGLLLHAGPSRQDDIATISGRLVPEFNKRRRFIS